SLAKNPFITWISSCDGKYSLVFAVKARTLIEFDKIMGEIRNRYWSFIMVHDTATIISGIHFHRDYLIQNKATTERKIMWGGMPEEAKLDEISIEILNELSADSRINAVKIASNLDISADAVIKRIKKLEQNGIIEHYMIWPNVNKLQGLYYKVLVTLHNFDEQKEKELHSYCLQNPNIVYIVKSLGSWQFEMDVEVRDIEEFRKLMRDFLKQFSNIVSDYTPLNIYDEHKYLFFEKECLK
ncbi:Lrp/AsnC family transcriptional regulator, partial [Candidatus Woesearchaeota archaeon]|nr:Lrp/AsnC family transcriptional regulator [Candidatus Woesearchaeota archaeon]